MQLEFNFDTNNDIEQLKKELKSCEFWILLGNEMKKGNCKNLLSFCNKITDYIVSNGLDNKLGWSWVPTVKRLRYKDLDKLDLSNIKEIAELLAAERIKEFPHFDPKK